MFGKSSPKKGNKPTVRIDTLIGQNTHIKGDIEFSGGLRVDGTITGNIRAVNNIESVLTLSEQGAINGEIRVPNMVINGTINGNVFALGHLELADKAKVKGNVYYRLLEMTVGSEVNGQLIRMSSDNDDNTHLQHDKAEQPSAVEPAQIEQKADS